VNELAADVVVVSAKIDPKLFRECERVRKAEGIATRNELIRRALDMYVGTHREAARMHAREEEAKQ